MLLIGLIARGLLDPDPQVVSGRANSSRSRSEQPLRPVTGIGNGACALKHSASVARVDLQYGCQLRSNGQTTNA